MDAPADAVDSLTTTFDDGARRPGTNAQPSDDADFIREFATTVELPFGLRMTVRTREANRVTPPDTIQFRHLGTRRSEGVHQPGRCIDYGACEPECPVNTILAGEALPDN